MHEAIQNMLKRYTCSNQQDYKNALKEIIQEAALLGLWRAKFFEHAAFYGGTSLRILYQLDRFSEDLDFSLLKPSTEFDLGPYQRAVKVELESFGFDVSMEEKIKREETAIKSAFLKANTLENLIKIGVPDKIRKKTHLDEVMKVKLEIDTDPPSGFNTDVRYLLQPVPFSVKAYDLPNLFAGKVHAILCRTWKNRVKGRDWYDFVWFVAQGTPVQLSHLELRLRQTGHYTKPDALSDSSLKELLAAKIELLDIEQAKKDVVVFLRDSSKVDIWSKEFFLSLVPRLKPLEPHPNALKNRKKQL